MTLSPKPGQQRVRKPASEEACTTNERVSGLGFRVRDSGFRVEDRLHRHGFKQQPTPKTTSINITSILQNESEYASNCSIPKHYQPAK